ncbi:hypothetical protein ACFQ1M_04730 [Sungkyunkwania multivorans]|uniref:Lauroyl/myristoyl acyltransferase n=1 Tax=Sungkyunkwania multivorans TaxID=1173618 RepID=A0ABW3CUW0_9FLAO
MKTLAEKAVALKKNIYNTNAKTEERYSKSVAFTSANLKRFLPQIPSKEHEQFYRDCLYNQHLSSLEEYDIGAIDAVDVINETSLPSLENIDQPLVFATYHLGSYRILNSYLTKLGLKTALIVDDEVYNAQANKFLNSWKKVEGHYKNGSDFVVLNAEKRTVLLQLMKLLRDNYVLIVYLDGNTGTGKRLSENPNLLSTNFLGHDIYTRKGFAYLSHIVKANIVTTLSYRDKGTTKLHFFEEIEYDPSVSREAHCQTVVKKCYDIFQSYLLKYPQQWEGWFYIHKWFETDLLEDQREDSKPSIAVRGFNSEEYALFKYCLNDYFILDKSNYKSILITKGIYEALKNNRYKQLGKNVLQQLMTNNIIV